jgi:hypothetical protein
VYHALAGSARGREHNYGFSPCLLGQRAWREDRKSEYHVNKVMGGRRHGRNAEYFYVPKLKKFVNKLDAGATGYFLATFKTFVNCS